MALEYAGWPSTLMTRGEGPPPDSAKRRNSFAAIRSRLGDNINLDGLAGRIDGAIKVRPIASDLHVCFVDPPGPIRTPQLTTNPMIQNGRVPPNPAPDRDVVDGETTLGHHLFQIPVAKRISQIPPHAEKDHHFLEVSTTEQCRPLLAHRVTIADRRIRLATEPRWFTHSATAINTNRKGQGLSGTGSFRKGSFRTVRRNAQTILLGLEGTLPSCNGN